MRWLLALMALGAAGCSTPRAGHDVPFRFERHQILLEVRVKERGPFTFLLDTGVTPSAIDTELARSLGLPLDEANAQPAGGAGAETVYIYPSRIEGLEIGRVAFGDIEAAAFPTGGLSRRLGEPSNGVLGDSFLQGRVVSIDYARRIVRIGGQAPAADAPGVYQFPLVTAPDDIMPLMEVRIGERAITVSMDTGSSFGIEVFESALSAAGLESAVADWEAGEAAGARGGFVTRRGALPRIAIGPFVLNDIPSVVTAREGEQHRQGNAGNALLQHFVVTFDYVGRTVSLRRVE